ncbi:MAG: hypothetical protein RJB66_2546 [Pseudomonadota bacterium]|jgi:hypothetical protein
MGCHAKLVRVTEGSNVVIILEHGWKVALLTKGPTKEVLESVHRDFKNRRTLNARRLVFNHTQEVTIDFEVLKSRTDSWSRLL